MSPARRSSGDEREGSPSRTTSSEAIGRAIKVFRTGRDISRRDLAERAGLSYSYLSEIENGTKQPSSKALSAIAEALDLPSYELMAAAETWRDGFTPTELDDSITPRMTRRRLMPPDEEPRYVEPWPSRPRRLLRGLLGAEREVRRELASPSSARISELVGLFSDLAPEDQERVLDMVRRLANE